MKFIRVRIGKRTFRIKDCKGLSSAWGLMFDDLKDKDGALIYANSVWMPFVKRRLNLVFLDKGMKIISQQIAVPISLDSKSWKVYKSASAKYCLELKDCTLKVKGKNKVEIIGSVV